MHVYPVDASLTADEAWHELCLMGVRATNTGSETWASIRCDGNECEGIASDPSQTSVQVDDLPADRAASPSAQTRSSGAGRATDAPGPSCPSTFPSERSVTL